ncbi:hypothetical protein F4777DRAFT_427534 [Nemania sp. FL0916]|nr:hypothetical protein F4777DRAFT_427534 [Nemania sp. FL0916]
MPKQRSEQLPPNIAYFEDADEDGCVRPDAKPHYARSVAPGSPRKQQPNTSKTRRDTRHTADVCSPTDSSDSTALPTGKGKLKIKPKDNRELGAVVAPKRRPTIRPAKTTPAHPSRMQDEFSGYYPPPPGAGPMRPRAHTRPESYYGQAPPLPPSQRMPMPMPMPGPGPGFYPGPPQGMVPPSYPPPSWQAPFPGPMPPPLQQPSQPLHPLPAPMDHNYPPKELSMRYRRPSSSMGFRQASNPYEYEASPERSVARRSSTSRKASKEVKEQEDRKRMPPPPRPKSTRPERTDRIVRPDRPERPERMERIVLKPQPPPANHRKSVVFDDDDLDGDSALYTGNYNMNRRDSGVEYGSRPFTNPRQSYDGAESIFNWEDDDDGEDDEEEYYYVDPAPKPRGRRRSQVEMDDKMRSASRYQDNMGGGLTAALTSEALRKAKSGASSRSTRSTASRDESEYKHSATTHTTRSSSGEEDITIKVPAGCTVEVGNVKIHSSEGGEVSVGRTGNSRFGSDRGTSIYDDDRRSRSDRSTAHGRNRSKGAYARGLPAPSSYTPSPLYYNQGYDDDDESEYFY